MSVVTSTRTIVTRKLGPLPVWAWALALVAAFLAYRAYRAGRDVPGTPMLNVRPPAPTIPPAEGAGGGGGPGLPQMPMDLLAGQQATIDALTSAIIGTDASAAGGPGAPPGAEAQAPPAPLAPEGTTVEFQGTTYDVSGQPEYSPGNFNPNSPAGVLAMNEWLGLTEQPAPAGQSAPTMSPWESALAARSQALNEMYGLGEAGGYQSTYATSAMLPPPQTQPGPQVQPQIGADDQILTANALAGKYVAV